LHPDNQHFQLDEWISRKIQSTALVATTAFSLQCILLSRFDTLVSQSTRLPPSSLIMDPGIDMPAKSSGNAQDLGTVLARLGLDQYEQRLVENGFETWETVTSITEADLREMDIRLGHRRKLQRAIYDYKNATTSQTHCSVADFPQPFRGLPIIGAESANLQTPPVPPKRAKRPYRRHPQPDHNAPRRPKTAYVSFSEHVRKDPAISRLSFAEIAKETGHRWSNLAYEERVNVWEKASADKMVEYDEENERYQKTESYHSYQAYLTDFKRKQRKRESVGLPDHRASPVFSSTSSGQSPASRNQGESQATRQAESDPAHPYRFNRITSDTPSQEITSPVEPGLEEVNKILNGLGIGAEYSKFNALPPEDMTNLAVEAFLHGSGSLLSLWDHDEAVNLVKTVYHPKDDSNHLDITEVFALATVGSFCDSEAATSSIPENFLHLFLSMLVSSSDISELHRMRLFTCLAVCRFTENIESARTLMCKQQNLLKGGYIGH
jgi:hypothetical protein